MFLALHRSTFLPVYKISCFLEASHALPHLHNQPVPIAVTGILHDDRDLHHKLHFHLVFNIISNCLDLWLISRFANNKKISYGFIDFTKVKRNDIFPFLFLNSGNDGFDDLRTLSQPVCTFYFCG